MAKWGHLSLGLVAMLLGLTACIHTPSNGSSDETGEVIGASAIAYNLVRLRVKVDVSLTLESCDPNPRARAIVTISPIAIPDGTRQYVIDGNTLKSFFEKREIGIELYPTGGIKNINATSADATAGILGGAIKLGSMLLAAEDQDELMDLEKCNKAVRNAIASRNRLRAEITNLTNSIADSAKASEVRENIEAMIFELARLETGLLSLELTTKLDIRDKKGQQGVVRWPQSAFNKWYDFKVKSEDKDPPTTGFGIKYCIEEVGSVLDQCVVKETDLKQTADNTRDGDKTTEDSPACQKCEYAIVLREPASAQIVISTLHSNQYWSNSSNGPLEMSTTLQRSVLPVPQWGKVDYIDLNAGFAENISVSASFDEFGKKTKFGWSSNARGEGIVNALNSVTESYKAAASTIAGENLAAVKARIDELDSLQKLNKLENCRSILENGGFVCPAE